MSSNRLPGKMLMDINGISLLGRVVERVKLSKLVSNVIVATSINKEDNQIAEFCSKSGINYFRGDLKNVANRFLEVAQNEKAESFVRISGDSPLLPPSILDHAIKIFMNNDYDLVTNVYPRTFPKGFSVEVIKTEAFKIINNQNLTNEQKEHITKIFYDNATGFKILNFKSNPNYSNLNFSVDTKRDFEKIRTILSDVNIIELDWKVLCKKHSLN